MLLIRISLLTDCTLNTDLALFIRHLIVPTTLSAADDHDDSSDDVSDTTRTKRGVVREREREEVCVWKWGRVLVVVVVVVVVVAARDHSRCKVPDVVPVFCRRRDDRVLAQVKSLRCSPLAVPTASDIISVSPSLWRPASAYGPFVR
ncbi:hypothetical protein C0Q70_07689 [Pomacea canaliculata]|uniref:Uncharacterized protein n=1 Tax=Pomacea canaliculata TaxID=400727 RepID=A0A2T7PFQ3_POMCA|nr:hypothetical protein C0Q70_07689 [Pomacea canaliculata]